MEVVGDLISSSFKRDMNSYTRGDFSLSLTSRDGDLGQGP